MEAIFENCCGIDVHKKTLTACIMIGGEGKITKKEIRTYSTMTEDIEGLRDWLKSEGVTHVAMESTGIYWRPVYNILEEGFEIMLVNARHIKNVPGRKTDVADSEWLCRLLRNGLLNGSFIPPIYIRQLRDLTRYRSKLNNNIAAEKNRLQKYLEDANIKLSSVATDTLGVSGRLMIRDIIKGNTDAEGLSELAKGRTKNTYLRDKYHRLAGRRGKKKAVVAIGHKILVMAYHILKDKVGYKELGADYLDRRNKDKVERYHVNKLRQLGYDVLLAEKVA